MIIDNTLMTLMSSSPKRLSKAKLRVIASLYENKSSFGLTSLQIYSHMFEDLGRADLTKVRMDNHRASDITMRDKYVVATDEMVTLVLSSLILKMEADNIGDTRIVDLGNDTQTPRKYLNYYIASRYIKSTDEDWVLDKLVQDVLDWFVYLRREYYDLDHFNKDIQVYMEVIRHHTPEKDAHVKWDK